MLIKCDLVLVVVVVCFLDMFMLVMFMLIGKTMIASMDTLVLTEVFSNNGLFNRCESLAHTS